MPISVKSTHVLHSSNFMSVDDKERRKKMRRETDGCVLTQDELDKLVEKVDKNNEGVIRGEYIQKELEEVKAQVNRLCNKITSGLWALVVFFFAVISAIIAGLWHVATWIQSVVEHSIRIT